MLAYYGLPTFVMTYEVKIVFNGRHLGFQRAACWGQSVNMGSVSIGIKVKAKLQLAEDPSRPGVQHFAEIVKGFCDNRSNLLAQSLLDSPGSHVFREPKEQTRCYIDLPSAEIQ
jgi:hypothetical protein